MVVTECGMSIVVKLLHSLKASYPIVVRVEEFEKSTLVKLAQYAKAELPIVVTLFGMMMLFKPLL